MTFSAATEKTTHNNNIIIYTMNPVPNHTKASLKS